MESIEKLNILTSKLQGRLSDAISSLVNQKVTLEMKQSGIIGVTEVHDLVSRPDQNVTTIYIPIMGDVTGDIFLFLNDNSANNVADLMIGNELGTTHLLTDFEESALKELGNIATGVIVTDMANDLNLSLMLTVPNIATDMVGALVDQVLVEYSESGNEILSVVFPFSIPSIDVQGGFLLLFDKSASDLIREKLQVTNQSVSGDS